ncbi:MAG: ATP-binding protein [Candidatus Methanomethyliaceae archaeon]|nr:ATP-binding protein [Candidatus Methanomethyliaceae archaeon]
MRIKERGSTEVRSIHIAVNRLLSTIEELKQKDLERMNELDKLVKERTAELEKYSKHLEELVEERTKELREKEKLAAIGEMAVMVGHDLRNPLQVIRYSTYLAKGVLGRGADCAANSPLIEYLNRIDNAVIYMDKIVSDLQDFSRPFNINKSDVPLISILQDAIAQIDIPKKIRVNIEADPSTVSIDTGLICRILVNLILNAVQAMPNGGNLTLSANYDGKTVTFLVSDTGFGISEDIKKKLFRPFFTTKPKGVGLGLVVVKRIIERLGGSIEVESEVNIGTKFIIKIPAV